jgi:hypothetical protein
MANEAKVAANRKNAKKSTGPKTVEGKATAAKNSWKHGLYALPPVVPGEEAGAYREWVDEWNTHYQPAGPGESVLIERAAHAGWRLRRCARVEAATLAKRVRHAAEKFQREEHARAENLGKRLMTVVETILNKERQSRQRGPVENPSVLQRELCAFAEGAAWLIDRWKALQGILETDGKWDDFDRLRAIVLMGKHAEHALEDGELRALCIACHATVQPIWDLWGDFQRAGAVGPPRAFYHTRVDNLMMAPRPDPVAARSILAALAAREIARLETLKTEHLDALAQLDRDEAAERALFDDSESGVALQRYEATLAMELRQSLRGLIRAQAPRIAAVRNEPITEVVEEKQVAVVDPKNEVISVAPPIIETPAQPVEASVSSHQPESALGKPFKRVPGVLSARVREAVERGRGEHEDERSARGHDKCDPRPSARTLVFENEAHRGDRHEPAPRMRLREGRRPGGASRL